MDTEKSNSSSFEDLSLANDLKESTDNLPATNADTSEKRVDDVMDIIGTGQLTKKVLVEGHPDIKPQRGDICKINAIGKLENGTVVENQQDLIVHVGDNEVVQGIDMALPLMGLGETAEVVCESRFAYGTIGLKNEQNPSASIPPGAKVTYTVELLSCDEEGDLEDQSFELRKSIGNRKRERGNFWYERNESNLAIQLYRRALEYLNDNGPGIEIPTKNDFTNAELQELLEIRVKVYNNLAAAQMKISAYEAALSSVENVLRCQPDNVKALFRKGKILEAKGEINASIPVLQKAATLDPDSKAIQQLLGKCILKSKREARNEKDMYQKMLGQAQRIEEKNRRPGRMSKNEDVPKLKLWGYLIGSILVGVAGVAMYRYKYF
ncbi:peptidyl-prolyl cis-trans isomerase FKBP8 [Bradysia coprophila]|uniref:peptidyl-prolyl cis-trans isomerase FKBP8 n=1 Tax=Bradysia coprophila TaxID=38358 RepID=UPI00187DB22A|nr:peptidyl-prolyl cis-trans isomerase FKBP8 [Bradysia coprophila]XP_037027191.1 peptidyl-prolyl cis-trans isomerase FKBP8 [Bradysia coprophila]